VEPGGINGIHAVLPYESQARLQDGAMRAGQKDGRHEHQVEAVKLLNMKVDKRGVRVC